jgi:hypothetical protein
MHGMTPRYLWDIGVPLVLAGAFLWAAKHYAKTGTKEYSPEYFRAPSAYVVTVASVAFPLIGAILALQPPDKLSPTLRSLLVSGLLLFLLALMVGAWLTFAIISHTANDKVKLDLPKDWHYPGALGLAYAFLLSGLVESFLYFAFNLTGEQTTAPVPTKEPRPLIARQRPQIGEAKDNVLLELGSPDTQTENGQSWHYQTENAALTIQLGPDGHVISIIERTVTANGK